MKKYIIQKSKLMCLFIVMLMTISCSESDSEPGNTDIQYNGNSLLGKWEWCKSIHYDKNNTVIATDYHGGYGWDLFFAPNNYLIQFSGEFPEYGGSYQNNKNGVSILTDDGYSDNFIINSFDGINLVFKEIWGHVDDDDEIQRNTDYILHSFKLIFHYKDKKPISKDANKFIGRWESNKYIYSFTRDISGYYSKQPNYVTTYFYYYELRDDGTLWVSSNDKFNNSNGYYEYLGTWSYDATNNVILFNAFVINKTISWKISSSFDDYWTGETMNDVREWTFQRVTE